MWIVNFHVEMDSELYKLFVTPRANSKIITIRLNHDLHERIKKYAEEKGLSLSALTRLLYIMALTGETQINITRKKVEVKPASTAIVRLKNTGAKQKALAERVIAKAEHVVSEFNKLQKDMAKMRHGYRMDNYSRASNRLQWLRKQAQEMMLEIEKAMDKVQDPDLLDRLYEYHKQMLQIYRTQI